MAGKKKGGSKKGGSKGIIGIITSVVSVCIVAALVIAFLRSTGNTDAESIIQSSKDSVAPTQSFADKVYSKAEQFLSCNILKNSNCISKPSGGLQDPGTTAPPSHGNLEDVFNKENNSHNNGGSIGNNNDSNNNNGSVGGNTQNGNGTNSDNNANTNDNSKSALEIKLDQITIADAEKTSYKRSDYPHWEIKNGKCDTRETVLANAGFASNAKTCKAEEKSGFTYTEPYSNKKVSNPSKLDIDHVIPLGYADAHGAHSWDTSKKQQFANDLSQLLAVDASANRTKSDKGPSEWMPSNKDYTCEYSTIWIDTALKYGISITNADKNTLKTGIQSCK